jgi:hypothetical protein
LYYRTSRGKEFFRGTYKIQNPHKGDFDFVAGERHCTQGKNQFPDFLSETSTSTTEHSSLFLFLKESTHIIKLIEPAISKIQSPEYKTFLSGISFITELYLERNIFSFGKIYRIKIYSRMLFVAKEIPPLFGRILKILDFQT